MENTASKTILIADDEIRMRRVIADYLHIKGYETLEAGDGVEALSLFESGRPDLILLDVMMPAWTGLGGLPPYSFQVPGAHYHAHGPFRGGRRAAGLFLGGG